MHLGYQCDYCMEKCERVIYIGTKPNTHYCSEECKEFGFLQDANPREEIEYVGGWPVK